MVRSNLAVVAFAAAAVAAPADTTSSCPLTTTTTQTQSYGLTNYNFFTTTKTPDIATTTRTQTNYITSGTTTVTVVDTSYITTCAVTTTENVEATPTEYTGTYTGTSLRPSTSCAPDRVIIDEYPFTTSKDSTVTDYVYPERIITVTSGTVHTETRTSGSTTAFTTGYTPCTTTVTSTTGTAAPVTQALKCAPTNLIGTDGKPGRRDRNAPWDGIASYGAGSIVPAEGRENGTGIHKDASACCQACQDDEACAASIWSGSPSDYPEYMPPSCKLFTQNEESCGLGFTIFTGEEKMAQAGSCGYIAENVYAEGLCEEGQTPRECEEAGVGKIVDSVSSP